MGSFNLSCLLLVVQFLFGSFIVASYIKSYRKTERYLSPHPIMLSSLLAQIASSTLLTLHLWVYSYDGEGHLVLDILSKVAQAFSEMTMTILLISLASGWTVTYQEIDLDENMEIYVPVIALVSMIHVLVSALTFIDDDSQHKYHDFAGVQGWVLLATKMLLWIYFVYTYFKTKKTI